jgi:chromosome segregation ATPase
VVVGALLAVFTVIQTWINKGRFDALEKRIDRLETSVATLRTDLEARIEAVRSDLEARIEAVRSDLEARIEAVRSDLEAKIDALRTSVERKLDSLRSDLTSVALAVDAKTRPQAG